MKYHVIDVVTKSRRRDRYLVVEAVGQCAGTGQSLHQELLPVPVLAVDGCNRVTITLTVTTHNKGDCFTEIISTQGNPPLSRIHCYIQWTFCVTELMQYTHSTTMLSTVMQWEQVEYQASVLSRLHFRNCFNYAIICIRIERIGWTLSTYYNATMKMRTQNIT